MVDTYVSGAYEEIREGSTPFSDIFINYQNLTAQLRGF